MIYLCNVTCGQVVVCLGTLLSPLAMSRLDCRHLNSLLLAATALATTGLGISFTWRLGATLGGWH